MRTGFTCKEAAVVLDISVTRVTQALDPAVTKIAKLFRADPSKTLRMIIERAEELPRAEDALRQALFERELDLREAMIDGAPGKPARCPG